MKITCNIIKDLLLIYNDEEVSDDTKLLVEEHLKTCDECKKYFGRVNQIMYETETLKVEKIETDKENKRIKKSLGKIRKRWVMSLAGIAILVPIVAFIGRLTSNQVHGSGLSYSNVDEVILCKNYLDKVKNQDFEALYDMMDISEDLNSIKEAYNVYMDEKSLKQFNEISLNGSTWCINGLVADDVINNETEYWMNIIKNNHMGVLIPEEVWNSVVTEPYQGFVYLQTKWGNYYTYGESKIEGEETILVPEKQILAAADNAVSLYWYMDVLPKEIVDEATLEIQASVDEQLEWLKAEYGQVLEMTDEEYTEHMKAEYKESFNEFWKKEYTITNVSYIDEDQNEKLTTDEETVVMHIELTGKDGKNEKGKIEFEIKNDKIWANAFFSNGEMLAELFETMRND